MGRGSSWLLLVTTSLVALSLAVVVGCGGGGGGDPSNGDPVNGDNGDGEVATTGNISGQVVCYGTGLADAVVSVGGQSSVSDSDGNFVITDITEGDGQLLTVQPPSSYVLESDEPVYVDVVVDQTTNLSEPIRLIMLGSPPPPPW